MYNDFNLRRNLSFGCWIAKEVVGVPKSEKTIIGTKLARLKAKAILSWYFCRVLVRFPTTELDPDIPLLIVINHPGYLDTKVTLFLAEDILLDFGQKYLT